MLYLRMPLSNLFATVGSHSGIICTVQLNEESFTSYKVKLKDRIEASILVLDDFKGVVGKSLPSIAKLDIKLFATDYTKLQDVMMAMFIA